MTKPWILLSLLLATPVFADSADLAVVPWTDNLGAFGFSVFNYGPESATNVVMTVDVPAALTIEGSFGSRCDTTVRPVRCTDTTVQLMGESLIFDFLVEAPPADATYTITAIVTADTPDPKASNNIATLSFSTQLTARLFPRIQPALARVDPGVPKTFVASLTNFDSSTATNVKARFGATNAVIESVQPTHSSVICSIASDGASAECVAPTLDEDCRCTGDIKVTLRPSADRAGAEARLALSGTSDLPDPEAGEPTVATLQTYRWLSVDTIEDRGPGSLRTAIEQANALCSPAPCKIVFEIPPPVPTEGWFTITPKTPLPAITADRVFVDGKSQRNTTGDTNPNGPVIAIDGHLAHFGPSIHSACEAVVQGLAIGNFDADQGLWFRESRLCDVYVNFGPDRQVITENFIGVDPSGKPWPNLRGVRADGANRGLLIDNVISHNTYSGVWMWGGAVALHRNRIEHNGASGVFLGPKTTFAEVLQNVITNQPQMGSRLRAAH